MREGSRREHEHKSISPELLLEIYEAVSAAQLIVTGKFDEKIKEFKEARGLLEEKLGLVKTIEEAKAEAAQAREIAGTLLAEASTTLEQARMKMEAAEARLRTAVAKEEELKTSGAELTKKWSELRQATAAFEQQKIQQATDASTRNAACEKLENELEKRERELVLSEQKLKRKLEVLRAA